MAELQICQVARYNSQVFYNIVDHSQEIFLNFFRCGYRI